MIRPRGSRVSSPPSAVGLPPPDPEVPDRQVRNAEDIAAAVRYAANARAAGRGPRLGRGAGADGPGRRCWWSTASMTEFTIDRGRMARLSAGLEWQPDLDAAAPFGLAANLPLGPRDRCGRIPHRRRRRTARPHLRVVARLRPGDGRGGGRRPDSSGHTQRKRRPVLGSTGRRGHARHRHLAGHGPGTASRSSTAARSGSTRTTPERYDTWRQMCADLCKAGTVVRAIMGDHSSRSLLRTDRRSADPCMRFGWVGQPRETGEGRLARIRQVATPVLDDDVKERPYPQIGAVLSDPVGPSAITQRGPRSLLRSPTRPSTP